MTFHALSNETDFDVNERIFRLSHFIMNHGQVTTHAKRGLVTIDDDILHSRTTIRSKTPLRRTYFYGLPSSAINATKMTVDDIQAGILTTYFNEGRNVDHEQQQYDSDNNIFSIGQQVQAHIPDIILDNLSDLIDHKGNISVPNERTYNNATLLFLDVSGFTSLTEQYSNDAHLGIDQLTSTLNSYFNEIVYEILAHNGDIYKFAGDAILSLWTNEHIGPQNALKCALHLQQKCGDYKTDVGVTLHLKVALAYGPVRVMFVGIDEFKHYLLTSDCVKNVNRCEQLCEPGDIILTRTVYDKLQSTSFNCEFMPVSDDVDPKHDYIAVKYPYLRNSFSEDSDTDECINNSIIIDQRMVCRHI